MNLTNSTKSKAFIDYYLPIFLISLSFFWKLIYIQQNDICMDEPFTIFNAQKSLIDVIKISLQGEPNPPLYMILLHFWIKLFGIGPFAVRFLSLIFNAFTVLFLYNTGKRFFNVWTGITASLLFVFSTLHFYHAIESRTYSLLSLETAASLYFFLRFTKNTNDRTALTGLIISNILMIYSHYFGWFVVFSQGITSLIYLKKTFKANLKIIYPFLGTIIGFLPMVPVIIRQFGKSSKGTWLNPPKSIDFINTLYLFLNHKVVIWIIITIISTGVIFFVGTLIRRKYTPFKKEIVVLLIWWLAPFCIMYFVSTKIPMFNVRYVLFNTIGLYIFIAVLINYLFQNHRILHPIGSFIILFSMCYYMKILPKEYSYREVSKAVEFAKKYETNNSIYIIWPVWTDFQFNYYYNQEIFKDYQNYYKTNLKHGIYRVWGLPNTKTVVRNNPDKRIIYIQDGVIKDPNENIETYLDSTYSIVQQSFFPQTIKVMVYDPI